MELEFLGTGAGVPAKERNVSSIALKLLDEINEVWLFDVGEATQHQILSTTIRPRKITKIFLTHLHGDHIFGLPGLLASRSFQGGSEPLTIYGPEKIEQFVNNALYVSNTKLSYKINYVKIKEDGVIFEDPKFKVVAKKMDHRVLSFGFRVEEKDRAGELQIDRLAPYNIKSGPIFGRLKRGEVVTLDDGTTLNGQDFIGDKKPGRIVTIIGDTRNNQRAFELAENADVLVHEATFGQEESDHAYAYYHSTSADAAKVAKDAGAKKLILTHISARYNGKNAYKLQKEAQNIFPNTKIVHDFDMIEIPMKG